MKGQQKRNEVTMPVTVHIHKTHRQFTNGLEVVAVEGRTVGECLSQLIRQFPEMEKAPVCHKRETAKQC